MGGTEHEPLGRAGQDQTAPFRAYMWIQEGVVSKRTRWVAGAASGAGRSPGRRCVRRAAIDGRRDHLSRASIKTSEKEGGPKRGLRVNFLEVAKKVASEFWTTGKRE